MSGVIAIIPAAGGGLRMGKELPKPFLEVAGAPLIIHTLERFERCPQVDCMVVLVDKDYLGLCRRIISHQPFEKIKEVIPGGERRMDSVKIGLSVIPETTELVVIHDGVRPLVSPSLISRVIEKAREVGAAIAAVPPVDTMKEAAEGYILNTIDRSRLMRAQTPQAFHYRIIMKAYQEAERKEVSATDDASLVEALGGKVAIVPGSHLNIKVTTPEDLMIAELLLKEGI
jgi:2-C-methyl-D-erythritol 4-phosphate cytidylyltransferase